jgi:hypothetical protein
VLAGTSNPMNDFDKFACTEISNALARIDAAALPDS